MEQTKSTLPRAFQKGGWYIINGEPMKFDGFMGDGSPVFQKAYSDMGRVFQLDNAYECGLLESATPIEDGSDLDEGVRAVQESKAAFCEKFGCE